MNRPMQQRLAQMNRAKHKPRVLSFSPQILPGILHFDGRQEAIQIARNRETGKMIFFLNGKRVSGLYDGWGNEIKITLTPLTE